jgi:hypothetical protein
VKSCEQLKPSRQAGQGLFALGSQLHTILGFNMPVGSSRTLRKKVKVEITDEEGTTYSLALHGTFSQEKVMRLMEIIDLLDHADHNASTTLPSKESTTYGKILKLIQSSYAAKEFSSADIAREYEERLASPIPLSTVSTYLSRLADRGILSRQKFGNSWVYRIVRLSGNQLAT